MLLLKDEPDYCLFQCAIAGTAALIVTGDRAMLDLGKHEAIRIVTLRAFRDYLSAGQPLQGN